MTYKVNSNKKELGSVTNILVDINSNIKES